MNDFTRVFELPYYQLAKFPKQDCLNVKENGQWKPYSTQTLIDNMNMASSAFLASGIKKGDAISIVSNNRPEWNFIDMGVMQVGAVTVPIYPTLSEEDYVYIMNNAETRMLFVSSQELYERMKKLQPRIPSLKEIYTFNKIDDAPHWSEFMKRGETGDQGAVKQTALGVSEQDVACMIDQLKIRDLDLAEKFRQRIDPEAIREFRVSHGDMPGEALIEAVAREQAEGSRKPLLAVQPLLFKRGGRRTLDQRIFLRLLDDLIHSHSSLFSIPNSCRRRVPAVLRAHGHRG